MTAFIGISTKNGRTPVIRTDLRVGIHQRLRLYSYIRKDETIGNPRWVLDRRHPQTSARTYIMRRYGLTKEESASLMRKRLESDCEICGSKYKLHIDHDHSSGRIRGILCFRCNTVLAAMEDRELHSNMHAYLRLKGCPSDDGPRG